MQKRMSAKELFQIYLSQVSDQELAKYMQPIIEEVKADVMQAAVQGAQNFYGAYPEGSYTRTGSFSNLGQGEPEIRRNGTDLELVFKFDSGEVSVNPWGKFPGNTEQAFDADYVNGFHGGPRKTKGGSWSWGQTPQSQSPLDYIYETLSGKYQGVKIYG